ncbi:MAG: hypothetical protein KatS3mg102_0776 [Planctomycetota bacterium]|nr:MAG: hypothetical protein KatS3mg102_0776 [Planctomycetota bacterium]
MPARGRRYLPQVAARATLQAAQPCELGIESVRIGAAAEAGEALERVLERVLERARAPLGGARPDLGLLWLTSHHAPAAAWALERVRAASGVRTLLGCSAEGVIGGEHELERRPAVALWLASLPGAAVRPLRLAPAELQALAARGEEPGAEAAWAAALGMASSAAEDRPAALLVLGEPFTLDAEALLEGLHRYLPGVPLLGGMASGGYGPGANILLLDGEVYTDGLVGVALGGALRVQAVISQGCRPLGRPLVVTRAEGNVIRALAGRPPLEQLRRLVQELPEREQRLLRRGLFIGRVIDERKHAFGRGDFLVRNVIGIDPDSGAMAVAEPMRAGITVQFHVRDADSADEDLRQLLAPQAADPPRGVVLFSCNGRGTRMYRAPDHDLRVIRELLGAVPVAGLFCAGELGPIGGRNFIHGYTASLALFRSPP